ncbi:Uracil DNA glycosylase superfamily protein [Rhizobium sp. 9140]|nr:Uracil DNA glycosylase superfamily protein [Rhizobium sp. 9140]
MNTAIKTALDALSDQLLNSSGAVFYTGMTAFTTCKPLYVLGLNPGGSASRQRSNTVRRDIRDYLLREEPWSAYIDERWEDAEPGSWGMQPRICHMLKKLHLDPRETPASNVIFVRTQSETLLKANKSVLLQECWPVHEAVIKVLQPRAILCLGRTAGSWVRKKVGADRKIDQFVESNRRGWASSAHKGGEGPIVLTVTHPGRVDWRNVEADPTPMVARCLNLY